MELFDYLQDNSCLFYLDINYSIQKPRQTSGLNPMGYLPLHNNAAKIPVVKLYQATAQINNQTNNSKQTGQNENLNEVELPKGASKDIKRAITNAKKDLNFWNKQLKDNMEKLSKVENDGEKEKCVKSIHEL